MKHLIVFLSLLIGTSAFAQQDTLAAPADTLNISESPAGNDTTIVRLGNHQLKIVERPGKDEILLEKKIDDEWRSTKDLKNDSEFRASDWQRRHSLTHWSGVTFGINGYVGKNQSLDLPEESQLMEVDYSKSFTFSINFPELKFRIISDYFGIYTGLGLQFNSYRLRQNTHLTFGNEVTMVEDTLRNLTRNTLQATYLRIPLMLEFNTSLRPTRSFHFAAGVVGGWRIHSTYVQEYNLTGVDYNTNVKGVPNLNLFSAEAMVRTGYGPFVVYASYWLTPLFDRKEGPELYPFSTGIGFAF